MFRAACVALVSVGALSGCATDYVQRMGKVRALYEAGDGDGAVALLDKSFKNTPDEKGINKLLLLLDRGMMLHAAGKWKESLATLHQADELSQKLDFTSVTEEAGVLLTNEGTRTYRGEDFEKLMISMLLALNYSALGQTEDALVEVRRINERITKMVVEEKKPYEQLAITRYLGAVLWESQNELDSAAIDYLEAAKTMKGALGSLAPEFLRILKKTARDDAYRDYKKKFPDVRDDALSKDAAQVVVVIEAGRAPKKESTQKEFAGGVGAPTLIAIPFYPPRLRALPNAKVSVGSESVTAAVVTSMDEVAQTHLNDRVGKLVAKQIASLAIKGALAAGVGAATNNKALGMLAFGLLAMTQQADTRSWLTLPAEFQVARLRVPPGATKVSVDYGGRVTTHPVDVKPGRIALVLVRRF